MSEIAAQIGANITRAREGAGLSRRELARRAGVSQQAVSTWESGEREIGAANLLALAEVLAVPVQTLYGRQFADPQTADAVVWWSGYREGWRACGENVRAAAALNPARFPPRPERSAAPDRGFGWRVDGRDWPAGGAGLSSAEAAAWLDGVTPRVAGQAGGVAATRGG